ncbi:SH3 domain-containing protein [Streptomyces sp. NPDC058442]|uniref:SH3 domain-containing protein n=1 Tax=Streptomyces sp. NPDC058442 TaxID=3346503 RepID=UPI0036492BE3
MRPSRIALSAAVLGALALPLVSATAATAAPTSMPTTRACDRPSPWSIGTQTVDIHSKTSAKSTRPGILHCGDCFTVHQTSGNRHHVTDTTPGVKGWISGTHVYRDVRMRFE